MFLPTCVPVLAPTTLSSPSILRVVFSVTDRPAGPPMFSVRSGHCQAGSSRGSVKILAAISPTSRAVATLAGDIPYGSAKRAFLAPSAVAADPISLTNRFLGLPRFFSLARMVRPT